MTEYWIDIDPRISVSIHVHFLQITWGIYLITIRTIQTSPQEQYKPHHKNNTNLTTRISQMIYICLTLHIYLFIRYILLRVFISCGSSFFFICTSIRLLIPLLFFLSYYFFPFHFPFLIGELQCRICDVKFQTSINNLTGNLTYG